MSRLPNFDLIYGNSSNMAILRNKEVHLIVTNPPYFPKKMEVYFQNLRAEQMQYQYEKVRQEVTEFALSLRPVYKEMARVLNDGGYLALQVSDLVYGRSIIPLASTHREMAESCGFYLTNHFYWQKCKSLQGVADYAKSPILGHCPQQDVEDIYIFTNNLSGSSRAIFLDLKPHEILKSLSPFWKIALPQKGIIAGQTPSSLVSRLINLYSTRGDLVLDPFSGSGTTLKTAVKMGRRAVGYEIDLELAGVSTTIGEEGKK